MPLALAISAGLFNAAASGLYGYVGAQDRSAALGNPVFVWQSIGQLLTLLGLLACVLLDLSAQKGHPPVRPTQRFCLSVVLGGGIAALATGLAFGLGAGLMLLGEALLLLLISALAFDRGLRAIATLLPLAALLRVIAAWGLSAFGLANYGIPVAFDDERAFQQAGVPIAHILRTLSGEPVVSFQNLQGSFLNFTGLVYLIGGPDYVLVRLANVLLGTLAVLIVGSVATTRYGRRAGRVAAGLATVWPSLLLWSGSGLREPLALGVELLVLWFLRDGKAGWLPAKVVGCGLALLTLLDLRPPVVLALSGAAAAAFLGSPGSRHMFAKPRTSAIALTLLALLAVIGAVTGSLGVGPATTLQKLNPRELEYRAAADQLTPLIEHDPARLPRRPDPSLLALGVVVRVRSGEPFKLRTGMTSGYTVSPLGYEVVFAPDDRETIQASDVQPLSDGNVGWGNVAARELQGLRLYFVPALPGSASFRQSATAPDTVLWSALVLVSVAALVVRRRSLSPPDLLAASYVILLVLGLGVASTNLGTVVRHRSSLVPWLIVIASPLLAVIFAGRIGTILDRLDRPRAHDQD